MKKIILGLVLLLFNSCVSPEQQEATIASNKSKYELFQKRVYSELERLEKRGIDKVFINRDFWGVIESEAASICGLKQKFFYHFDNTTNNEWVLGNRSPKKDVVYCSRELLSVDPVYGNEKIYKVNDTLGYTVYSSNIIEKKTNYNSMQAELWEKNKPKTNKEKSEVISSIKLTCKEFGFKEGTEKFAECLKDLYLKDNAQNSQPIIIQGDSGSNALADEMKRQRSQQNTEKLLGLSQELLKGKSLGEIYGGGPPKTSGGSGSCTLTNSVQSGTNRICYYRCGVGTQTSNVGASQICPLTM